MKLNKYISCPRLIQNKIQSCFSDFENSFTAAGFGFSAADNYKNNGKRIHNKDK